MCESFHAWPARDGAPSLRFQPVFTGQGQVHEYAVVDRPTPSTGGLSDIGAQRARLRAATAFATRSGAALDLSFAHALTVPHDADPAQRLCADLDIGLAHDELCIGLPASHERLQWPARRLTFHIPLLPRLVPRGHLLACHAEFAPGLRAQLLGASSGTLRGSGLTLRIPPGLGADRALQRRFRALVEYAADAGFDVFADDIRDIYDFAWLRRLPGLLFRGPALSAPLSASCLGSWLRADGGAWRSFHACVPQSGPPGE